MTDYTLHDFMEHRWADAKVELRKLDPSFVTSLDTAVRLEHIGLVTPWRADPAKKPKARLSSNWHRLLEACMELAMQMDCLTTAAKSLLPSAFKDKSIEEVGREATYHFRSWFVHANTLADRLEFVIDWTTTVYIGSGAKKTAVDRRFKRQVYQRVRQRVENQRNQYAHGAVRSWARGITEDRLWEGGVTAGLLPIRFLPEFVYAPEGTSVLAGKRSLFQSQTEQILESMGAILRELGIELGIA